MNTLLLRLSIIVALAIVPGFAIGADHIDAPLLRTEAEASVDITDVFVFRSPVDSSRLVLALNVFTPVGNPASARLFEPRESAEYVFQIDTDGDLVPEHSIITTFNDGEGGQQRFTVRNVPGAGALVGSVTVAGEEVETVTRDGALAFAGLRDDPFFFDFEGFNAFLAAPCVPAAGLRCPGTGEPTNFFLGLNVSSIVLEFPITNLRGVDSAVEGKINVWAITTRR